VRPSEAAAPSAFGRERCHSLSAADELLLVQAGALARVLEDWCQPFPGFFLYYPGRRQVSPALAAFIDAIRVPAKTRSHRPLT
jgi:DNA-binding transcriptional LysR family regulator